MRKLSILFLLLFLPYGVFASNLLINEVAWMGTSISTADEWLELKNITASSIDIAGWRLEWRNGEYGITFDKEKCTNTVLTGGGFILLERTNNETLPEIAADCIYTGALSNNGEHVVLKDADGVTIDEVDASGGWHVGDNTTKETMQRSNGNWITAQATPRAENKILSSSASSTAGSNISNTSETTYISPPIVFPMMNVYAGEDRKVVVGSEVEFIGYAAGPDDTPIEGARFLWNFGDGAMQEGRSVLHMYGVPGRYTVGLHVSTGLYALSDYREVEVLPNKVVIADVLFGEQGFITLFNPSELQIDIGRWSLDDLGALFIIPSKTKIGPNAKIALANSVTTLFHHDKNQPVVLRYPNGFSAFIWSRKTQISIAEEKRILAKDEPIFDGKSAVGSVSLLASKDTPKTEEISEDVSLYATGTELAYAGASFIQHPWSMILGAFLLSFVSAVSFLFFRRWINPPL